MEEFLVGSSNIILFKLLLLSFLFLKIVLASRYILTGQMTYLFTEEIVFTALVDSTTFKEKRVFLFAIFAFSVTLTPMLISIWTSRQTPLH